MPLIGYARVSTEDQTPLPQSQALKSAGCVEIHEEQASGGNRARPVLARVLERIGKGDTLVVVRIDRLALVVALGTLLPMVAAAQTVVPQSVEAEATEFKVTLSDGRVLRSRDLVGARLVIAEHTPDGWTPLRSVPATRANVAALSRPGATGPAPAASTDRGLW